MIVAWLKRRAVAWRDRQRAADAEFLWPAIASQCNFLQFVEAVSTHMVNDGAWFMHEHEWIGTDVDPFVWWNKNAASPAKGGA